MIDAHRFDLYDEPMERLSDLEAYAKQTSSALFALAAKILISREEEGVQAVAMSTGIAYAIAGLMRAFPLHAARHQLYMPVELLARHDVEPSQIFAGQSSNGLRAAFTELQNLARRNLDIARENIPALPSAGLPAFLPVALLRPSLALLARCDPFAPAELAPWRRQWLIWRAARNPARIAR